MAWWLLFALGGDAEARVNVGDEDLSPLHRLCAAIQEEADWQEAFYVLSGSWGVALQALLQLAALGEVWDTACRGSFGDMLRDGPGSSVPTGQDLDGDFLLDADELAFGLDPASPDSDRDGLADDLDPSWLADLLDGEGQGRLATLAALAEGEVLSGDPAAAIDLLTEVQAALRCGPDLVVGSQTCLGVQLLTADLGRGA